MVVSLVTSLFLGVLAASAPVLDNAKAINSYTIYIDSKSVVLSGIDGPDFAQYCKRADSSSYACGREATEYLSLLLKGRKVTCKIVDQVVPAAGKCLANGKDVALLMLQGGYAVLPFENRGRAVPKYYRSAANSASTRRVGLWAGTFTNPTEWRRGHTNSEVFVERR